VYFACTLSLGKEVMSEWGWRLPFLLSVLLTAFGIWVRSSLGNDAKPVTDAEKRSPIREVLKFYWKEVVAIAFATTSTGIVSFVGFMFIVPWSVKEAGISINLALGINLLSLFLVSLFCVLGGHLGDRYGRVHIARLGVFILLVGAWPAFALVKMGSLVPLILGGLIMAIGQGFCVGPMCAAMASLLPAKVRITGIGLGYSFSVGVFGGFAPMLTEYLFARHHLVMAPALVISGGALVSLIALNTSIWRNSSELLPEEI
jgi:MHS family proline/betaine transporter-like MFS transporter